MFQPHTIRDRLSFAGINPARLRNVTYKLISRVQDDPDIQIRATALALYTMCQAAGVDIRTLLANTDRLMNDLDGPFSGEIRAMREYTKHEIGRG